MKFNLKSLSIGAILLVFGLMIAHSWNSTAHLSPPDQHGINVMEAGIFDAPHVSLVNALKSMHNSAEMWQPPHHDNSLQGVGTDEDPIGVDHAKYVAKWTQASTSAPTATIIDNELTGNGTITRSGTGVYVWEVNSAQLTANLTYSSCTVGNATGLVCKTYAISDSTLSVKTFDAAGAAVDLGGTLFLEVDVYPE